jgi:hypothetical protein
LTVGYDEGRKALPVNGMSVSWLPQTGHISGAPSLQTPNANDGHSNANDRATNANFPLASADGLRAGVVASVDALVVVLVTVSVQASAVAVA